jgi:hypothetical protein
MGIPHQDSKKVICSFKPLVPVGNPQPSAFSGRVLYVMRTQETFYVCSAIIPQDVGDLRHADVGYYLAIERAHENNLDVLQIL